MHARALVVGFDCATPQWVFEPWLPELPTIRSLTERAAWGILHSCDPPITVPAWASMTSSRSPGRSFSMASGIVATTPTARPRVRRLARVARVPRLWDLLSARGRRVIVLGVPQTYPVSRVNGVMVSCFLTPDTEQSQYTYPPELKSEIERVVGRYMVDV